MLNAHHNRSDDMGAKVSAETKRAVKLFQAGGISVAAAAAKCGILPTTLYRALERAGVRAQIPRAVKT